MLPDPTRLEQGKLLGLHLLGLQDTLNSTAAPSQPQQLSTASFHGGADTLYSLGCAIFWAALVTNIYFSFPSLQPRAGWDKEKKSSRLLDQIS